MYSSTISWLRHNLEVRGQLHAPAALPPGKSHRYPFYRRLDGPQSRSGRWTFLTLPGLELPPLVVQPVDSRYTVRAVRAIPALFFILGVDIFVPFKCIRFTSLIIAPRGIYVAVKWQLSRLSEINEYRMKIWHFTRMEKVTPEYDFPRRLLYQVSKLLLVLRILISNDDIRSKCFMVNEIRFILQC
jgi:hypothetical protein